MTPSSAAIASNVAPSTTIARARSIEKALALQGWKKDAQGRWKHATLRGVSPGATLAAQAYTSAPLIKAGRGIVRLRTENDPPHERKRYARAMTLEDARVDVEKATERLAKAKANLKEIEKAAREAASAAPRRSVLTPDRLRFAFGTYISSR